MRQEKSCGAVIVRNELEDLEVLLIHQVQGHWCFPKGHVEKDETEIETARREIQEETGLSVEFEEGFRTSTSYSPKENVMKEVVYFLARPIGGVIKPQLEEVSELQWVTLVQAQALITYENDLKLLHQAVNYLKLQQEES